MTHPKPTQAEDGEFPDTSVTCPSCGHHWYRKPSQRERIYEAAHNGTTFLTLLRMLDQNRCGICGKKLKDSDEINIDHITPKSKNGKNNWRNYQVTHVACNAAKGDKTDFAVKPLHGTEDELDSLKSTWQAEARREVLEKLPEKREVINYDITKSSQPDTDNFNVGFNEAIDLMRERLE